MLKSILKTMRPRQWTKNAFVFAALVFDKQLFRLPSFLTTCAGFWLFCMVSGAVYIINDLADLEADRCHPQKRLRPLASGALLARHAKIACCLILSAAGLSAWLLSTKFFAILAAYLLTNLAYSRWLKRVPMLDVFLIALGFVLRVASGAALIGVDRFSPWLYLLTTLLALFLGFGKRRSELFLLQSSAKTHRPALDGYTLPLLDQIITILSSGLIMAYGLYTFTAPPLSDNNWMMATIPFVIYGIFRYLYLVMAKGSGGAPEEILLTDKPLQITITLWIASILIYLYLLV